MNADSAVAPATPQVERTAAAVVTGPGRKGAYGQDRKPTFVDRFGVWLSDRPVARVVRRYPSPAVLDLGCGYHARMLRRLEAAGRITRGVGVDLHIAPEAVNSGAASTRIRYCESPIDAALQQMTSAGERFDVILLISVLEHLWDASAALASCRELLSPGGSLVINVPNWRGKVFLECSAFRLGLSPAEEMDDHKMYYAKRDLWPLLVRAGFRPSRIRMWNHKLGLNLFAVAQAQG